MKILFVPYRFGTDLMGGAEIYHVQIVRNLIRADHDVDVLTTTGGSFESKTRFGLLWREGKPPGDVREDLGGGVTARVIRCPIKNPSLPSLWFACYRLQKQFEQEQQKFNPALVRPVARPLCFTGWQFPEVHGAEVWRWCGARASLVLPLGTRYLAIRGQAPWRRTVTITMAGGTVHHRESVSGSFQLAVDVPPDDRGAILWLEMPVRWGSPKDVRTLGLFVNRIAADTEAGPVAADLWEDFHHAMSRRARAGAAADSPTDEWVEQLAGIARTRDAKFSGLFDMARGPQSPALEKWLAANTSQYDVIIAANYPFSTPGAVMRQRKAHGRPVALLSLMHLDDEFYYWNHYLDYLMQADAVLTISDYASRLFRHWGARAHFIGVGIEPERLEAAPEADIRAFRVKAGLAADEPYVLMVCRKSPTKNYPTVIGAMRRLLEAGSANSSPNARLIFIGNEEDNVALSDSFIIRLEGLTDTEMRAAYAGASAMTLMSETESFGMVFLEAWAQGTPVIGSAWCRPVAALIEHGADGFLARGEGDLTAHLATLLAHPDAARAMGRRGREKVLRDFTQQAMTARLTTALILMKSKQL